jgi:Gametolysin peptidase M11
MMLLLLRPCLLVLLLASFDFPLAVGAASFTVSQPRQLDVQYHSVLVVRILSAGSSDSDGSILENELRNVLFDDANYSVQRQMQDCSGGRIILQLERIVAVTVSSVSRTSGDVEAWTTAAAEQVLSQHFTMQDVNVMGYKEQLRNLADHVLLILPNTFPSSQFVANAEVGRSLCVFSIEWMQSMSAFMHEMGHNLGLRHSGKGDSQPYADRTGYMGVSTPIAWAPQKCYNAAQHWQLGWYSEHQWSLVNQDISSPRLISLAAFPDHQKVSSGQYAILLQLTDSIYVQFNRAKSYNRGTDMMPDQVVVVRDDQDKTVLLAGLDLTTQTTLRLSSVAIQVCSLNINYSDESGIDYAVVAVAASDNGAMCSGSSLSTALAAVDSPTPVSPAPISPAPVSPAPISPSPISPSPITPAPTTDEPTTPAPTTPEPSTSEPSTAEPSPSPVSTPRPSTLRPVSTPTDSPATPAPSEAHTADPSGSINAVIIKVPIMITTGNSTTNTNFALASRDRPWLRIGLMASAAVLLVLVVVLLPIVRRRIRRRTKQYQQPKGKQQEVEDLEEANSRPWTFWYWGGEYELDLGP